jgi:hypothetical protein
MASPLSKIEPTTRAIRQSLKNNCWGTYMGLSNSPDIFRITDARKRQGVMQVRAQFSGSWYTLYPNNSIFQQ